MGSSSCKKNTLKDCVCSAVKTIYLGKPRPSTQKKPHGRHSCKPARFVLAAEKLCVEHYVRRAARTKAIYGKVLFDRFTGRGKGTIKEWTLRNRFVPALFGFVWQPPAKECASEKRVLAKGHWPKQNAADASSSMRHESCE